MLRAILSPSNSFPAFQGYAFPVAFSDFPVTVVALLLLLTGQALEIFLRVLLTAALVTRCYCCQPWFTERPESSRQYSKVKHLEMQDRNTGPTGSESVISTAHSTASGK